MKIVIIGLFPPPCSGHDASAMIGAEAKNNRSLDLLAVRSMLFLPASNPRAIAKAKIAGADLVVLDLEDSVRPTDKEVARRAAVEAAAEPWPMPVAIRVNGVGTSWHSLDVDAVAGSSAAFLILPRATSAHVMKELGVLAARPVLAMIETAAGVLAANEIAKACAGLVAGTNDLRADLRLPLSGTRQPIALSLQMIVLAARAAGILCIDGVFNRLDDIGGFEREAEEGRQLGFDGKSLIHPDQIVPCHRAFAPSPAELEHAKALVEAFRGGAERFGNEMIERMHVEVAQRLLERAA